MQADQYPRLRFLLHPTRFLPGLIPALFLLCTFTHSHAQVLHRHDKWFFGYNAALDFSSGAPVALAGSMMGTDEGCASIATPSGDLMFYTDGITVYNSQHQIMPNGTNLYGHISSSQSALIVQMPGSDSLWYIFTAQSPVFFSYRGLAWSLVDMSLDGGLGAVTIKNQILTDSIAEKLTATRHANGRDVWVVTHRWPSDAFYAYRVSCDGIYGPVISHTGRVQEQGAPWSYGNSSIGCMKISPDGSRIALTWSADLNETEPVFEGWVEYFHFDNATGIVSDPHELYIPDFRTYGVGFSPDSRLLYATTFGLQGGISYSDLRQWDLTAADVPASMWLNLTYDPAPGTFQLGPDGVLYIARTGFVSYLSAILQPDSIGAACQFNAAAVFHSGMSTWGLPNNWDTWPAVSPPDIFPFTDSTLCEGASMLLDASLPEATAWIWSDGSTGPTLSVNDSGWVSVQVVIACDTVSDSVFLHLESCTSGNQSFTICEGDTLMLNASTAGAESYRWNTGSSSPFIITADSGWFWADIRIAGQLVRDSFHVQMQDCRCIEVQNVFTPNGDGINDCFCPVVECELSEFSVVIFDRWGNKIITSTDPQLYWQGNTAAGAPLPEGVYYYLIQYSQPGLRSRQLAGYVTLLR